MDERLLKGLLFFIVLPTIFYLIAIFLKTIALLVINTFPEKKFSKFMARCILIPNTTNLAGKLYLILPIVLSIALVGVTFIHY